MHSPLVASALLLTAASIGSLPGVAGSYGTSSGPGVWGAGRGSVHTRLEASEPAEGDSVAPPERVRLVFNNPVNPALSRMNLIGGDGAAWTLKVEAGEAPEVLVAAAPELAGGAYTLEWRVVSADGHAVSGDFGFHVISTAAPVGAAGADRDLGESGGGAADAAPEPAADVAAVGTTGGGSEQELAEHGRFPTTLALFRGLATSALMALAGLLVFMVWITPGTSERTVTLTRTLAVVAPLLLAVHLGAWIRSTAPPGGLDLSWVRAVLSGTGTGRAETTRFLCALAALIALWRRHEGGAAILTLTAVGVSGAVGHALAVDRMLSVPAKSGHLLASALWLGGLLILVTARGDGPEFLAQVRRVSAVALTAVVAIAFTGLVQAIILLPGPQGLVTTTYGRMVLAKIGGLLVLVAFGARNRRFLIPKLTEGAGAGPLQRSCTLETWVMIGVILLAGFLSYTPLPE